MLVDDISDVGVDNARQDNLQQPINIDDDEYSRSCINKITGIIESMCQTIPLEQQDAVDSVEKLQANLCRLLDLFLEQPFLLDACLEQWIIKIVRRLLSLTNADKVTLILCNAIYDICRVRGYKFIVRFFPHSVEEFSLVAHFYSQIILQKSTKGEGITATINEEYWKMRYVALLLFGSIMKLPFPLDLLLKKVPNNEGEKLLCSIIVSAKSILQCPGREGEAAIFLLTSYFRRIDRLDQFIDFIDDILSDDLVDKHTGILSVISKACHLIDRDNLQSLLGKALNKLMLKLEELITRPSSSKKASEWKLLHLRLRLNLLDDPQEIINLCYLYLNDDEARLRWAAAKGIARVLASLNSPAIIERVMQNLVNTLENHLLAPLPPYNTINSLAITIGCIYQRVTFSVEMMPFTGLIDVVTTMLRLEAPRGRVTAAASIRDAASYVIWALVRSFPSNYSIANKQEWSLRFAEALLCAALFDRETGCRRAASAAFQELVGRCGDVVPHGLHLFDLINFFEVHHLRRNMGGIAIKIAEQCPVYLPTMLKYLQTVSIKSWDRGIRNLAAPLLGKLLGSSIMNNLPDNVKWRSFIFNDLLHQARDFDDLGTQHGAILTLAHCDVLNDEEFEELATLSLLLVDVPPKKMLGWQLLASAVYEIMTSICQYLQRKTFITDEIISNIRAKWVPAWFNVLQQGLATRDPELHELIVNHTLPAIYTVLPARDSLISEFIRGFLLPSADKDRNINAQVGATLAIGATPEWLFLERAAPMSRLLLKFISPGQMQAGDRAASVSSLPCVEKRVNAIKAISSLYSLRFAEMMETDQKSNLKLPIELVLEALGGLITAMDDYSIDSRGDIGSLVRLAAMDGVAKIYFSIHNEQWVGVEEGRIAELNILLKAWKGKMVRYVFDKLDRLRLAALKHLEDLDSLNLPWSFLKEHYNRPDSLFSALKESIENDTDGNNGMWKLFHEEIFIGLLSSASSINKMISEPALHCFVTVFKRQTEELKLIAITERIFNVDGKSNSTPNKHLERLERPFLSIIDRLLPEEAQLVSTALIKIVLPRAIQLADDPRINMHDVMVSVSLIKKVSQLGNSLSSTAYEWVQNAAQHHPFPRVRELLGRIRNL